MINKNKVENKDQNVYNEENVLVYLFRRDAGIFGGNADSFRLI